jgi:glycosyltransferase involved in cell wall biosynthesis
MQVCFFILNAFDFDSRARLICRDILDAGWRLDIIATDEGKLDKFYDASIHRLPQPIWPFRQRRFIEYNLKAAAIAKGINANIYHAVDLDTLWAAVKAARATGGKVIYESRELYTELLALKNRSLAKSFWRMLEKRLIHKADSVITINQSIADELTKRYNIRKPAVAMNVAEIKEVEEPIDLRKKYDLGCEFVLIYQGVLRPGQGILRSLRLLRNLPEVGIVFVGDGLYRGEIEKRIVEYGLSSQVRFAGMVSPDDLPRYTAGADAGLLLMEAAAINNYLALPQKIFQYIAAGVPPIVTDLPELAKIARQDNLGVVLDNDNENDDAAIVGQFLRQGLSDAKKACNREKSKYNWNVEGDKIMSVYRGLV